MFSSQKLFGEDRFHSFKKLSSRFKNEEEKLKTKRKVSFTIVFKNDKQP